MKYLIVVLLLAISVPSWAAGKLRILLTNDDGFDAPGIKALHSSLESAGHDVYLIAPATQQSGAAASVTSGGVEVTQHSDRIWAVHGRPADAVRFGLGSVLYNIPPDLVIAGANFGQNTGQDVKVSGTVGAALTAHQLGIPAIAISVGIRFEEGRKGFPSTQAAFPNAASFLTRLVANLDIDAMPGVLNVNYPAELPLDVRGIRWSQLSNHSILSQKYNRKEDGRYAPDFTPPHPNARKHDAESLVDGFITLTYLDGDMEVIANRAQKRISKGLLDRDFQPVEHGKRDLRVVPELLANEELEPQPKRKLREVPTKTEPPATKKPEVVTSEPDLVIPHREPAVVESEADVVITAKEPEVLESEADFIYTHQEPDVVESDPDIVFPTEAVEPEETQVVLSEPEPVEEPAPEPEIVAEPEPELDLSKEPVKNKPDSWLRRIFRPSDWRRSP